MAELTVGRGPLVSIVIPVYNGGNFLAEAIDCALAQTYRNVEVVVVDDGSDDGGATARICAGYGNRIRYFYKANGGVATALNYGLQVMRGEFFSWLSHDDGYTPDRVAIMLDAHRCRSSTSGLPLILSSDFEVIDQHGAHVRFHRPPYRLDSLGELAAVDWGPHGCSLFIPREIFERAGLFHPRLPTTQDSDMWVRMRRFARFEHVCEVTVRGRAHDGQGSRTAWHLRETVLNRLAVQDRLDSGFIPDPEPRNIHRYRRMLAKSALETRPGVYQNVLLRLGHALRAQTIGLLWAGDPAQFPHALVAALQAAGHRLRIAIAGTASAAGVFQAATALDTELVWLWDRPLREPTATLRAMLDYLVANPRLAGCVHGSAPWRGTASVLGPFHAALLPRAILLEMPLQHSEPWTVVAHRALQQGGLWQHRRTAETALASAEPPPTIPRPGRREVALFERRGMPFGAPRRLREFGAWSVATLMVRAMRLADRARTARMPVRTSLRGPTRLQALAAYACRWRRPANLLHHAIWRLSACPELARLRLLRLHGLAGHFDPEWYLRAYPDVRAAGVDPTLHYLCSGRWEDRDPSAGFSARLYRSDHPAVGASAVPPLQHYALWGRFESRRVRRSGVVTAAREGATADSRTSTLVLAYDQGSPEATQVAEALAAQLGRPVRPVLLSFGIDGCGRPLDAASGDWLADVPLSSAGVAGLGAVRADRLLVIANARPSAALARLPGNLGVPHEVIAVGPREPFADLPPLVHGLFARARLRHALSNDLAAALRAQGAGAVEVAGLPDPGRLGWVRPWQRNALPGACCRVALFGTVRGDELALLLAALRWVHARTLPFVFSLYGSAAVDLPQALRGVFQHVRVEDEEQRSIAVSRFHPHVAWIPYRRPADAVLPLADAAMSGLPIVACDSSDARGYLAGRALTRLLPSRSGVRRWLHAIYAAAHEDAVDPWVPGHPLEGFRARDRELADRVRDRMLEEHR